MPEKYSVWQLPIDLQSSYILDSIDDIFDGFYITLSDQNNKNIKVKIIFKNSVNAHQLFVDQAIVNYRRSLIGITQPVDSLFFTVQN